MIFCRFSVAGLWPGVGWLLLSTSILPSVGRQRNIFSSWMCTGSLFGQEDWFDGFIFKLWISKGLSWARRIGLMVLSLSCESRKALFVIVGDMVIILVETEDPGYFYWTLACLQCLRTLVREGWQLDALFQLSFYFSGIASCDPQLILSHCLYGFRERLSVVVSRCTLPGWCKLC